MWLITRQLLTILLLTGYTVSPAMLNAIFIRFSKKRKFFNFDDFVFCLASLNLATSMLYHMIYICCITWSIMPCIFVSANYQKLKGRGEIDMDLGKVTLVVAPYVVITTLLLQYLRIALNLWTTAAAVRLEYYCIFYCLVFQEQYISERTNYI